MPSQPVRLYQGDSLDRSFHKPRYTVPVTIDYVFVYVCICARMVCASALRFVVFLCVLNSRKIPNLTEETSRALSTAME